MVYQIYYMPKPNEEPDNYYVLFDIEYYMEQTNDHKWYSELHCLPIVEGLTRFLEKHLKQEDIDVEQFIKDSNEIEELRGLLYERYNNKPKSMEEAHIFHYKTFWNVLDKIIRDFAKKYDLYLNID